MTTMNQKWPQALFPITTSSLLKLENHAMHGSETWHACVFQHFHDNHQQKWPKAVFPLTTSSLLKLANHTVKLGTHVYLGVSMTTMTSGNFHYNYFFTSQTSKS